MVKLVVNIDFLVHFDVLDEPLTGLRYISDLGSVGSHAADMWGLLVSLTFIWDNTLIEFLNYLLGNSGFQVGQLRVIVINLHFHEW